MGGLGGEEEGMGREAGERMEGRMREIQVGKDVH